MECYLIFIFVETQILISTATEILYVLPDNSTNAISCPSQPCATLSQYVLDNGTLPVVSNVEYHFLPGEHHVPANLVLQNLYNFSIIGKTKSSVVLVGCSQSYVIYIIYSHFVTISNVEFKRCGLLPEHVMNFTNVKLSCCFSCIIENVTLINHGVMAFNLIGRSYLNNVKLEIVHPLLLCCQTIFIKYTTCLSWNSYDYHTHVLTVNQLFSHGTMKYHKSTDNPSVFLLLESTIYVVNTLLANSYFYNMDRAALKIKNRCSPTKKVIIVENCSFELISGSDSIVTVFISHINKITKFIKCVFYGNSAQVISISVILRSTFMCKLATNGKFLLFIANISFIKCQFVDNDRQLLTIENKLHAMGKLNVLFEYLDVLKILILELY